MSQRPNARAGSNVVRGSTWRSILRSSDDSRRWAEATAPAGARTANHHHDGAPRLRRDAPRCAEVRRDAPRCAEMRRDCAEMRRDAPSLTSAVAMQVAVIMLTNLVFAPITSPLIGRLGLRAAPRTARRGHQLDASPTSSAAMSPMPSMSFGYSSQLLAGDCNSYSIRTYASQLLAGWRELSFQILRSTMQ